MQIITLYRYERADGGVTVSPIKPECEYTERVRLVADEGKELTKDGENFTTCVDTDTADGWREVKVGENGEIIDPDEISDSEALAIITGGEQ